MADGTSLAWRDEVDGWLGGLAWYPPTEGAPLDEDLLDLGGELREEFDRAG